LPKMADLEMQVKDAHAQGKAEGLREAALVAKEATSAMCQKCGHPQDNHPYRHPFVGRIVGDVSAAILALIPADTPAAKVTVHEAAKVLLGDEYTSPLLDVLDAYNNDHEVGQDVLKSLRAIAGGRDE